MHIEFLVEEPSMEDTLKNLIPKIAGTNITFKIHPFQGKQDLLKQLPSRLKGYKSWLPDDFYIVVIIDRDQEDCYALKNKLETYALCANLITKSNRLFNSHFHVLNRIAIQELEAWFFGDIVALRNAYPRLPSNIGRKSQYRDPDNMPSKPSVALERELRYAGYIKSSIFFSKIRAARKISPFMEPDRNQSKSFQVFRDGILTILNFQSSNPHIFE